MKKNAFRWIGFVLSLVTILNLLGLSSFVSAFAAEGSASLSAENAEQHQEATTKNDERESQSPFAGKTVRFSKYIYNLDDSADYIYIEFEEGGYVIFVRETLEMMEFSLEGALPYSNSEARNYYGGPANYLQKLNSRFIDMQTNEEIDISHEEAVTFSQQIRNTFLSKTEYRTHLTTTQGTIESELNSFWGSKNCDTSRNASDTGGNTLLNCGATFIANYQYFMANPIHYESQISYCGPIAAQILLGYHNYYNDRRIINDQYLLGFDDTTATVVDFSKNPNYCSDPMTMTPYTTGTRSEFTGNNSFFAKVADAIAAYDSNAAPGIAPGSANSSMVSSGIASILSENLPSAGYSVNHSGISDPTIHALLKNEIDAGRPVIIAYHNASGDGNHASVMCGYWDGFRDYEGGDTYEGYIIYTGLETVNYTWINSSLFYSCVFLELHHEHNYTYVGTIEQGNVGNTNQISRKEYECSVCGHRTDAAITLTDQTQYAEYPASIPRKEFSDYAYKEYYTTFETAKCMLFQTFSNMDTQLYLFDTEYNLLAEDNDDGLGYNALFCYTVSANTPYILRVQVSNESGMNDIANIKFAITPASYECADYEEIEAMTGTGESWGIDLYYDTTFVLTFTPSASGTYRIKTTPDDDIDIVVYVTDATSSNACICDDNGSTSQISNFTMEMTANKSYFIVLSSADISTEEGFVDFVISKIS